jgi:hypothetical protein
MSYPVTQEQVALPLHFAVPHVYKLCVFELGGEQLRQLDADFRVPAFPFDKKNLILAIQHNVNIVFLILLKLLNPWLLKSPHLHLKAIPETLKQFVSGGIDQHPHLVACQQGVGVVKGVIARLNDVLAVVEAEGGDKREGVLRGEADGVQAVRPDNKNIGYERVIAHPDNFV